MKSTSKNPREHTTVFSSKAISAQAVYFLLLWWCLLSRWVMSTLSAVLLFLQFPIQTCFSSMLVS